MVTLLTDIQVIRLSERTGDAILVEKIFAVEALNLRA